MQRDIRTNECHRMLETETADRESNIESFFRNELLKRRLFTEDDLPIAAYSIEVEATAPSQAEADTGETLAYPNDVSDQDRPQGIGQGAHRLDTVVGKELTNAHVFTRFRVKCFGEEVMAYIGMESPPYMWKIARNSLF